MKFHRPRRWIAIAGVVAATLAAGCDAESPSPVTPAASLDPVCGASAPGSQVVVYSSPGLEYWYADALTTFQTDCAVSVYYASLPAGQELQRLQTEQAQPVADIVVAPGPDIAAIADAGLLDPAGTPGSDVVPADRCDGGRRWCTLLETYASWVRSASLGSSAPQRWADMLAPRWHGRILTSPPDQTLDGLAMAALLQQIDGDAASRAYLAQLEGNVGAHLLNTDTMSRLVSGGGDDLANGNLQEHLNDTAQYPGLQPWFPADSEGVPTTVAIPYGAALVRGSPHRDAATALLQWFWSSEAQNDAGSGDCAPGRSGVTPADSRSVAMRAALQGVHVVRADWEAVARQRGALKAWWATVQRAPFSSAAPAAPTPTPNLPPPPSP